MKCTRCAAPRTAWAKACSYCGLVFDTYRESTDPIEAEDTPREGGAAPGTKAVDGAAPRVDGGSPAAVLTRLAQRPDVQRLVAERDGLPTPPRRSGLANLFPLLLTGAFAALVLHQTRLEDGSFPGSSLGIAGGFVAIGLFAVVRGAQRARILASAPLVAEPVHVRVRDVTMQEPGVGNPKAGKHGHGRTRWTLELADGSRRHTWPVSDARGKDQLQHGVYGVAWTQGPNLLRFERVE